MGYAIEMGIQRAQQEKESKKLQKTKGCTLITIEHLVTMPIKKKF